MSEAYTRFKQTLSLSLGLRPLGDCFHSPLKAIHNLNYEVSKQRTSQLQPTLNMQGVVKDNDPISLLFSPVVIIEHEEDTTIERLYIIAATILAKQK